MKCPFELPVESRESVAAVDLRYIASKNTVCYICGDVSERYADYIVQAINSHEKLKKALRRFGHHDSPCAGILDLNDDAECTCGFEQALKEAGEEQ